MDNFKIIGISTVTTNESMVDIENLWGKFWGENIADKIPNKVGDEFYAVYTDYESDHTGKYTLIIGFPVTTLDNIPDGFVGREILVGKAEKYISKGKMPEAILKTWTEIWQDTELKRAYRESASGYFS